MDRNSCSRRKYLAAVGSVGVASVAGCSGESEADGASTTVAEQTETGTPAGTATATQTPTPELLEGPPEGLVLELTDVPEAGWSIIDDSEVGDDPFPSYIREFRRETSNGTIERITNQVQVRDSVTQATQGYDEFGYEEFYAIGPSTTESLSLGTESEWARGQRDPNQYTNHVRVRELNVAGYVAWHQVNNQNEYTAVDRAEIEPLAETMVERWG